MKASRYATSRQKSCQQCSSAKAKCDRQKHCARCIQRGLSCIYSQTAGHVQIDSSIISKTNSNGSGTKSVVSFENPNSQISAEFNPIMAPNSTSVTEAVANTQSQHQAFATCSNSHTSPVPSYERSVIGAEERRPFNQSNLDFQNLDLACPINVEEISNRWLNPYIPTPGQKIKNYPATVTSFIYRVLKSYSAVAVRGHRALPFIHPKQSLSGSPLATCLSLIRICEKPLPGSENSAALVLQREMEAIAETRNDYDDMDLLAAFQSYLIYTMALFFHLSQGFNPFFRQAMMNLQELACLTSRQGLVCAADRLHSRPRWEEWIVTEAKRRTLYVMYLFDNILSAQESLPTFLGTELQGLPAPANKPLWQAENRADWEKEFNVYLTKWTTHSLTIDELWPIPQGMDEAGITHRRERVDQWLENMDEFGIMIFTVTVCTHGG